MKSANGYSKNNGNNRTEAAKKGSKNKEMGTEDASCKNGLQFAMTWNLLACKFSQAVPIPFQTSKKRFQKVADDEDHLHLCKYGSEVKVSSELKQNKGRNDKEGKQASLECFVGFIFDQLVHNLQKFDQSLQKMSSKDSSSQLDNLRAILSTWKSHKVDINGLFGNLKFARVGGIPSNIVGVSSKEHPDKKKLISVQDFFRYTEDEGMKFFEELDRDGDGQITLEDLEFAMRERKLPSTYAREFMRDTRSHLFSKSFGWKQFLSLMERREPIILRAYTSLCLDDSGSLTKSDILTSLENAGLPANEDNAVAMMRFLNTETEESVCYGHFRNFMLLLPSDRLRDDPRSVWFEAANVVADAPSAEVSTGSVLRSALAGGLSCAFSCAIMHPVDTVKTQVQASTLTLPKIISKLPEIGLRGLFKGSTPAILGQFSSHGLRTGICEVSKIVLINVAPTLPDIQVESISSFCGTFLGTAARIPCEVLKQRLQAGQFDNVGQAIIGTWQEGGLKRLFSGTGVTLCRELPFYVAGMGFYAESKKFVQYLLKRELEPWETIVVGALSGGLTGVLTTPFDVIKTRMMTAQGSSMPMSMVAMSILRQEGPLALYRGAVPRFFWIAPLGAINFAGYELTRKALDKLAGHP